MNYDALQAELAKPAYAGLSDQEAADVLNAETITETYSRFVSFRTLMAELTPEEYRSVRATFTAAAASDVLLADAQAAMAAEAGGIDFGHANTRALIDTLFAADAALAAKLKGLGEHTVSWMGANQMPPIKWWQVTEIRAGMEVA
jgi:hypothetical protein